MKSYKRIIPIFASVALALWVLWANTAPEITEITVESDDLPEDFDGCRIAHISDLHNAVFGRENQKLLSLLRDAQPEFIVITGDLVDSRRTDIASALDFAREAALIAPCYYVTGNHESRLLQINDLLQELQEAGVTVLLDEAVTLERNGSCVSLLGLADNALRRRTGGPSVDSTLDALVDAAGDYTILLSHRPELFSTYARHGIDLTFAGHVHGGQFQLPFLGGLYAPDQGLFPEYDSGLYTSGDSRMIVSRGLGNSVFPLRLNNRPELIVATLKRAQ